MVVSIDFDAMCVKVRRFPIDEPITAVAGGTTSIVAEAVGAGGDTVGVVDTEEVNRIICIVRVMDMGVSRRPLTKSV